MDFPSQFHHQPDSLPGTGQQLLPPQFASIPPLTPTDDYRNTSPPDGLPYNQFQSLAYDPPSFPDQSAFDGPPTPPANGTAAQRHPEQHQQQYLQQQQSHSYDGPDAGGALAGAAGQQLSNSLADNGADGMNGAGSDDDDYSYRTPAQLRRKAQNRAAQRAFRERKEKRVKDLETKITSLEDAAKESNAEIDRLRRDLQKASTENEILRATTTTNTNTSNSSNDSRSNMSPARHIEDTTFSGPKSYNPTEFFSTVLGPHQNKSLSHRVVSGPGGERLLAVAAAWELITGCEAFRRGAVDLARVSEELKSVAKCDGQGPVFAERDILRAVEVSIDEGGDDLL